MAKSSAHNGELKTAVHEVDGGVVIHHQQDVSGILDENAQLRQTEQNSKAEMQHVARIPLIVYQKWDKEFQKQNKGMTLMNAPAHLKQGFMMRKLNDLAYAKLRTGGGKL